MLTKLLKYEFRATARLFGPFYLVLIVFALVNRMIRFERLVDLDASIFGFGFLEMLGFLARLVYFVLIVGVLVMTLLIMVQRFYKSLLGDEGYLMFTLPVRSWQHIVSKLITAVTWATASGLVTAGSIMIFTAKAGLWPALREGVKNINDTFGITAFFVYPGAVLAAMASGILVIYAAIALGQLSSRHRILASFGWFAALDFASKALVLALFLPSAQAYWEKITDAVSDAMSINLMAVWFVILPTIVLSLLHFFLTNYILDRRLNLE